MIVALAESDAGAAGRDAPRWEASGDENPRYSDIRSSCPASLGLRRSSQSRIAGRATASSWSFHQARRNVTRPFVDRRDHPGVLFQFRLGLLREDVGAAP